MDPQFRSESIQSPEFLQNKVLIESLVADKIALQRRLERSEIVREKAIQLVAKYEPVSIERGENGLIFTLSNGIEHTSLVNSSFLGTVGPIIHTNRPIVGSPAFPINSNVPSNPVQPQYATTFIPQVVGKVNPQVAPQNVPQVSSKASSQAPSKAPSNSSSNSSSKAPPQAQPQAPSQAPSRAHSHVSMKVSPQISNQKNVQQPAQNNTSSSNGKTQEVTASKEISNPPNHKPSPELQKLQAQTIKRLQQHQDSLSPGSVSPQDSEPSITNSRSPFVDTTNTDTTKNSQVLNIQKPNNDSNVPKSTTKSRNLFFLPNTDSFDNSRPKVSTEPSSDRSSAYATPEKGSENENTPNEKNLEAVSSSKVPSKESSDQTPHAPQPSTTASTPEESEQPQTREPTQPSSSTSPQSNPIQHSTNTNDNSDQSSSTPQKRSEDELSTPDPKRSKPNEPRTYQQYETVSKCLDFLHSSDYALVVSLELNQNKRYKNLDTLLDHIYYHFCLRNRVLLAAKKTDLSKGGVCQYHCHTCAKIILKATVYPNQEASITFLDKNHECSFDNIMGKFKILWKSDPNVSSKLKIYQDFFNQNGLSKVKSLIYQYGLRKKSQSEISKQTAGFLNSHPVLLGDLVKAVDNTNDQLTHLLSLYVLRLTDKDVNDDTLRQFASNQGLQFVYNTK
ncbi:Immunoglobulin A1 protease [Wickerhamomyces ciferrii]|uniref:Immunoglobulin A1 protease n=1 Tax=Wickerhamomyces ciferrii (strain ATCC 14091 / BCRC 22168 / CBS 111 / JCM 3599 / NBRC 0793 / NRRL Y-1031 F-60-10) TaxID=1206466 RepID=K0KA68_WICCF|nr:Immunoglobulin A1 protease [Wickerhamomyces ciferrii]CCH41825.1 Immunoglobulin A1 protease [Wickerhamomyces ciferrii]